MNGQAAAATAGVPTYKHHGDIHYVWDDGNNPIQIRLKNLFVIAIGQAGASFTIYPNDTGGNYDPGCIKGTSSFQAVTPGGGIRNDGERNGWNSHYLGCGAFLGGSGRPINLYYGDDNGSKTLTPTGALGAFCAAGTKKVPSCGDNAVASIFAETTGFLNNMTSKCLAGLCAFDCSTQGGLNISVNKILVRYSAVDKFEVVNDVTYSGPINKCLENLRTSYSQTLEEFAPCPNDSACTAGSP